MIKKVTLLICNFSVLLAIAQSPWVEQKRRAYTQLSYTTIPNYTNIFGNPDYATERKVSDNTLKFYVEYGILEHVSLTFDIPLKLIKTGDLVSPNTNPETDAMDASANLGNIALSVKYNFIRKKWLVTGQLGIGANTSFYFEDSGVRTGYDSWEIIPTISVGRGFTKSYLQGFVGLPLKFAGYSSSFKTGVEYGYKVLKPIWLTAFANMQYSFKNGKIELPKENISTGLYLNDQEFVAYGIKVIAEFKHNFGLVVGVTSAFSGNNVPKKTPMDIGIFYKF